MKGRLIALDHINGREAAALMVDGRLHDIWIAKDDMPQPGTIFRGIIDRPMKGQGGVMVRIPGDTGFLRKAKVLAPGAIVLVQTSGFAEVGKAIPVTQRVLFKSRYAIVTPDAPGLNVSRAIKDDDRRDELTVIARACMDGATAGLILRSVCENADDDDIIEDIEAMLGACETAFSADGTEPEMVLAGDGPHVMAWREWVAPAEVVTTSGCFEDHGVMDELDKLESAHVQFGACDMYIEPTRALTAIDVNTGADTSPAAPLKANLAAIKELPRQLRLRGLGGQITIDFAPILNRDRKQIEAALRNAFRADSVDTEVVGWTPLGHVELKRKRERRPLSELLS